ncbi:MAG: FAD-binding oxidoreductase [Ignavibacteria bacterium]|nr:FAD-binding oxidoreductase [Ignavibacteria bacterium]
MLKKTNRDEIESYLVDASNYKGNCDVVYFPESEDEIISIIKDANTNKIPVTIAGNGTGLTGARVPDSGIVISTEKLNQIIEINREENFIIVETGVILSTILEKLKEHNLLYPPDPTEQNCFIGATIATNASGAKTFKYGPTRDYVLSLSLILPTGDKLELERGKNFAFNNSLTLIISDEKRINIELPRIEMPNTKNASGYFIKENMDAIDLFIGSEGTLGIITKAKLKVLPYPFDTLSCVVFFKNEVDGINFVSRSRELSRLNENDFSARALEFFDRNALQFLKDDFNEIDSTASCAVWFEQETTTENEDSLTEEWFNLIEKCNGKLDNIWVGMQEVDKMKIKEFRHAISYKVNEYISRNNFRKLGTDVAVPDDVFRDFYFFCQNLVTESDIDSVCYGHFGNSHIHLNMLPKSDDEFLKGKNLYKQICEKAVELKGTVSAEHGIGKIKTDYLLMMFGTEGVNKMRNIKKVLDPNNILGRGTMFTPD